MLNSRRQFLKVAGSALLATIPASSISLNEAQAEQSCSEWQPYNYGYVRSCTVGVRVNRLRTQACDQWCWAACIEAAFRIAGYRVSQERIVEKLYGSQFICRPAIGPGIASAVQGYWVDDRGDEFYADVHVLADLQFGIVDPFALQDASRYLANNIPLINGAVGHATLMTAMSWIEDNFGQYQLQEIIVRDPWPGNQNRRQLTYREFSGTNFLAAVIVD